MAIRVRIERVEVGYSGSFATYKGENLINRAIERINRYNIATRIEYVEVEDYDGYISPDCKGEDLLKVQILNKYPCNHIAEVEWYYVEEVEDAEDDYYYDDSRRFYEDDTSYDTYEGWRQQDTIDMYRRER